MNYDVAIVGGGASGLAAASFFGSLTVSSRKKFNICVIEGNFRLGKKLSATGNGQGNVGNTSISPRNYHSAEPQNFSGGSVKMAYDIISRRQRVYETLFHGIFTADEKGRIYPSGRQASALTDCLIKELAAHNIATFTGVKVTGIKKDGLFRLTLSDGKCISAKYVLLCVGGKAQKQFGTDGSSYALAEAFGHKITPLYPSLVQLKADTTHIKTLRGIRADCNLTAVVDGKEVASSRGDVIFTEYGISGNAVFSVSPAFAGKTGEAVIEFAPDISFEALRRDIWGKQKLGYAESELLTLTLNNQIGRAIIKRAASDKPEDIAVMAKHFTLNVTGTLGFDYAQVTHGGVDMRFVTDELESKLCKNLFFAGEVLDIDGDCGGYNLTWAFASACHVALAIASREALSEGV